MSRSVGGGRETHEDRFGGRLFITLGEAADLYGVSVRTARRWAADYIASDGARGIPVVQVSKRRRLVVVSLLGRNLPVGPTADARTGANSPHFSAPVVSHHESTAHPAPKRKEGRDMQHHETRGRFTTSTSSDGTTNQAPDIAGAFDRLSLIDQLLGADPDVLRAVEETLAWAERDGHLDERG
jgi:hypothetical protein